MKRALISVFDKTGIVEFAKSLDSMNGDTFRNGLLLGMKIPF